MTATTPTKLKFELEKAFAAPAPATARGIVTTEAVLTLNNGLGAGVGHSADSTWKAVNTGRVLEAWFTPIDNLPDLHAFGAIWVKASGQHATDVEIHWHDTAAHQAAAVRIKIYAFVEQ